MEMETKEILEALRREYCRINWGYSKETPDEFIVIIQDKKNPRRPFLAGELMLHGSYKLQLLLLGGVNGVIEAWGEVKQQYARNKFTDHMFRNMEWLERYVKREGIHE